MVVNILREKMSITAVFCFFVVVFFLKANYAKKGDFTHFCPDNLSRFKCLFDNVYGSVILESPRVESQCYFNRSHITPAL